MKKQKYVLNFLLIIGLTVLVLWLALKDNYEEVLGAISQMNGLFLAVILSWGILYTVVWGFVYFVLGKKYVSNYSLWKGIVVAFTGTFFSGITPSSTGGQFAQAYILKKQGIKVSDGASLLWADFIIYQTTMMIYVTVLFLLKYQYYVSQSAWFNLIMLGYVINAIVILALYTMALFPNVYVTLSGAIIKVLARLRIIKDPQKKMDSLMLQMKSFTVEIKALSKDKKRILLCALINVLRLTLLYSQPFLVAWGLGIELPLATVIDVIALSSFVTIANSFIPIPGASGGTEFVFSLLFYSLMKNLTSAVMVLWRFSTYHIVLFFGGLLFMIEKSRFERKENQLRDGSISVFDKEA